MKKTENGVVKTSSKKKKIVIFTTIAVLIIALLLGGGYYYFSQPRAILKESINYLTKGFKTVEEENKMLELLKKNDRVKYQGTFRLSFDESLELGLKDLDFIILAKEDQKEKIAQYMLKANIDEKNLFEINSYFKENKMYFLIKDIMEKYYFTNQEYISFLDTSSEDDLNIIMDVITDSVKKVIRDNRFKKENIAKEIDGKEEKLKKLSLDITEELLAEIVEAFVQQINDNEKVMDALIRLTESEKAEIKEILEGLLTAVENPSKDVLMTYNVYYKGINEIRMIELSLEDISLTYTANQDFHIELKENNTVLADIRVEEAEWTDLVNVQERKITATIGDIKIHGSYKEAEEDFNLTLNLKQNNQELGKLIISGKETGDSKEKVTIEVKNGETTFVKAIIDTEFTFGEKVETEELKDAKDVNDMTEEEATKILENIKNHETLGPIFELILGSSEDEDFPLNDYNYDYQDNFES